MWKYLLHMCVKYNYLQYITNKYFTKLHKWPIKREKVSTLLAFKEMESKQHATFHLSNISIYLYLYLYF